ncbi:MAG: ankyrin repeat domain-containing protein [Planctomycetota bacterium]|nr:ankyrin repeat domain-containing protein [Planctomycetota bacterium]
METPSNPAPQAASRLRWRLPRWTSFLAAGMWGLSIAMPVWETLSDERGVWQTFNGLWPLLLGWLGALMYCPAWFANLLALLLFICDFGEGILSDRVRWWLGLIMLALAATAYYFPGLPDDYDMAVITARLSGFYLWLGSFLVFVVGHANQTSRTNPGLGLRRWGVVALFVLLYGILELTFPVGATPMQQALKNPAPLTPLQAELAKHPSEAQMADAYASAVRNAMRAASGPDEAGRLRQVEAILAAGVPVDLRDRNGDTPLLQASRSPRAKALLDLLIRSRADVNAHGMGDQCALDLADDFGNPEGWKLLVAAGATIPKGRPKNPHIPPPTTQPATSPATAP